MAEDKKEKHEKKPKQPKPEGAGAGQKKAKKSKGPAAEAQADAGADETPQAPAPPPRMIATYREQVVPALIERFKYKNRLAVPRMEKIVISMGLGKAVTSGEKGKMEQAEKELAVIAGQKPVRCKAIKSVA